MKEERLPLRKGHYLKITFIKRNKPMDTDAKDFETYRTDRPVSVECMGDDKIYYHVVQCDIYSYCDYWLLYDKWTILRVESWEE